MSRQGAQKRPTVLEDVLAAYEAMQSARSRSPAGEQAAHFVEIDDLVGRTREDRETARRVNAFLHDERGTAEHTTTDGRGTKSRMLFSRNGDQVALRVRARRGLLTGEVRGEGRLVNVEGQPEIQITGLHFRSRSPVARVDSAPSRIRIYTDENDGRIHYDFDRPFSLTNNFTGGSAYQQDAGRYLANPPPPAQREGERRRGRGNRK
jgi:hypothetical protein